MRKRKTEERIKAIEMHKQGIPRRRIAEELGVSHDSVKTWISLYKSGQKDLLDDTRLLHHTRVKTIRAVATTDIFLLSEQKALLCYFISLRNLLKTSCFG